MTTVQFTVPPPFSDDEVTVTVVVTGEAGELHWVPEGAPSWCRHLAVQDGSIRACLLCGRSYDRLTYLYALERAIRDRYRLPQSPWTAAERSVDLD